MNLIYEYKGKQYCEYWLDTPKYAGSLYKLILKLEEDGEVFESGMDFYAEKDPGRMFKDYEELLLYEFEELVIGRYK